MSQRSIDIIEFQIYVPGFIRGEVHPLIVAVDHNREIVSAIPFLTDEMPMMMTTEHGHDPRIIEDGKEILISPFLGILAVPVVNCGNMHNADFDRSRLESRILDNLLKPLQLCLAISVIDSGP